MVDPSTQDHPAVISFVSHRDEDEPLISSLADLPEKERWQSVTLSGHKIRELTGLAEFASIRDLSVTQCEVESLESSTDWKILHSIDLSFNELEDIDALQNLPQAQSLNLAHNQLKRLPVNLNWPQIEELALSANNSLLLAKGLPLLPQLKRLYIKQLSFPEKSIWRSFPQLKELYATAGGSDACVGVSDLSKLEMLHLHLKTGFDLALLQLSSSVKSLTLTRGQNLQNTDALGQFHSLEVLTLHYLQIKNWDFLTDLPNLRELNLKGSYPRIEEIRNRFPQLNLNT